MTLVPLTLQWNAMIQVCLSVCISVHPRKDRRFGFPPQPILGKFLTDCHSSVYHKYNAGWRSCLPNQDGCPNVSTRGSCPLQSILSFLHMLQLQHPITKSNGVVSYWIVMSNRGAWFRIGLNAEGTDTCLIELFLFYRCNHVLQHLPISLIFWFCCHQTCLSVEQCWLTDQCPIQNTHRNLCTDTHTYARTHARTVLSTWSTPFVSIKSPSISAVWSESVIEWACIDLKFPQRERRCLCYPGPCYV